MQLEDLHVRKLVYACYPAYHNSRQWRKDRLYSFWRKLYDISDESEKLILAQLGLVAVVRLFKIKLDLLFCGAGS